jgi:hypothetical protein
MRLSVAVAFAAPGVALLVDVTLPAGATVADAVAASGLVARCGLPEQALAYAIHGQRADRDTPLVDGDRVEMTRPLIADPKQARHARAARHPLPRAVAAKRPPRARS